MTRNKSAFFALVLALGLALLVVARAATPPLAPDLGTTQSFAVLAGTGVTNTGPTILNGDLGSCPTPAITGFPPGVVISGTVHAADGVACGAQSDLTLAYDDVAGRAPTLTLVDPSDIGGSTLTTGVYKAPSSMAITGTLTLDGEGNPDAVFIFQAASTLVTAPNSHVLLINGAQPCNVFWQVGSSATLDVGTTFVGTILALTSITANTNATVQGRLLARNGATTLDSNTITPTACAPTTPTTVSPTTTTTTTGPAAVLPTTPTTLQTLTTPTTRPSSTTGTTGPATTTSFSSSGPRIPQLPSTGSPLRGPVLAVGLGLAVGSSLARRAGRGVRRDGSAGR